MRLTDSLLKALAELKAKEDASGDYKKSGTYNGRILLFTIATTRLIFLF